MLEQGSIRLFTFQGIPVRLHWSFALLILWVWYIGFRAGMGWPAIGVLGLLILSLFACVVMHEFGHALAARRYGVRTRDIILSPIGGVARLDRIPEKPAQELVVALAGPAVNVLIALVLGLIAWLTLPQRLTIQGETETAIFWIGNYVPLLFWMNLWLVLFNMIPAFPMDGGRVLRALLAMRFGRLKATHWASVVGRVLAVLFIITAFVEQHLFLGLIGLFVYVMASQEYKMVQADHLYRQFRAADVTRRQFTLLHPHETVGRAIDILKQGLETNFLIGEHPTLPEGSISADDLLRARDNGHEGTAISHFARSIPARIHQSTPLNEIFMHFQQDPGTFLLVTDDEGQCIGVLDRDQIDHVLYWANRRKGVTA
jgi:Zn-dependent protease